MNTKEKQYWFDKSLKAMEMLLGIVNVPEEDVILFGSEFGTNGWNVKVCRDHINYFEEFNSFIKKDDNIIDHYIKKRWQLTNNLIRFYFTWQPPSIDSSYENSIKLESLNLAARIAFPLIEEMARRMSGFWDEDGIMLKDKPADINLFSKSSSGKVTERNYKKDKNRIIDFLHKLKLLEYSLNDKLKTTIQSLDNAVCQTLVIGVTSEMSPLYERLQFHRDMWLHGRKFNGLVSPFLSIFLSLIYFGND